MTRAEDAKGATTCLTAGALSVEDLPDNKTRTGKSDLYTLHTVKTKTEVNYINRG